MALLRVLLISSAIIVLVQSFPSTTMNFERESTSESETKEITDPTAKPKQQPQAMLEIESNSERESSTVEFVFKSPKEGSSIQKGSNRDKYIISNFPTKNEAGKLNTLDSSKANDINNIRKDESYKFNITAILKNGDLLSEAQIKRDKWLLEPEEISSIMGGHPKYFNDAAKSIYPFPEMIESVKNIAFNYRTVNTNSPVPIIEKSYQPPQTGGPPLYPQSVFSREIDIPFHF